MAALERLAEQTAGVFPHTPDPSSKILTLSTAPVDKFACPERIVHSGTDECS